MKLDAAQEKLKAILTDLDRPISRMAEQLSDLHDSLLESDRLKVFQWLSTTQYVKHHRSAVKMCLAGSGDWMFRKPLYMEWRKSSVSSILWLHGIPGSGKTVLVSSVIESFKAVESSDAMAAPAAYFYCARDAAEPERAHPDEIMRKHIRPRRKKPKDVIRKTWVLMRL